MMLMMAAHLCTAPEDEAIKCFCYKDLVRNGGVVGLGLVWYSAKTVAKQLPLVCLCWQSNNVSMWLQTPETVSKEWTCRRPPFQSNLPNIQNKTS
jgi:hypothetical protein